MEYTDCWAAGHFADLSIVQVERQTRLVDHVFLRRDARLRKLQQVQLLTVRDDFLVASVVATAYRVQVRRLQAFPDFVQVLAA